MGKRRGSSRGGGTHRGGGRSFRGRKPGRGRGGLTQRQRSTPAFQSEIHEEQELQSLIDDGDLVIPGPQKPARSSARQRRGLGLQKSRTMREEAEYTSQQLSRTMRLQLRNHPIEFVKATEVYDPNKALVHKDEDVDVERDLEKNMRDEEEESKLGTANDIEMPKMKGIDEDSTKNDDDIELEGYIDADAQVAEMELEDDCAPIEDKNALDIEVESIAGDFPGDTISSHIKGDHKSKEVEIQSDSEGSGGLSSSVPYLEDKTKDLRKLANNRPKVSSPSPLIEEQSDGQFEEQLVEQLDNNQAKNEAKESSDLGFFIDTDGDLHVNGLTKPLNSLSMTMEVPETSSAIEYNPTITIGNVTLNVEKKNGVPVAELMSIPLLNRAAPRGFLDNNLENELHVYDLDDSDREHYKDYIAQVIRNMDDDSEYESDTNFDMYERVEESSEDEGEDGSESDSESNSDSEFEVEPELEDDTPEYGYLEEDYEFDISQLSISNIRFGTKNSYYTRCLGITGSPNEYMWIEEDEVHDYVLMNGVREHRLHAFLQLVTDGLIDQVEQEQPSYSDVYISESEDDDEDEDNLASLVEFSINKPQKPDFDSIGSTESLRTSGKGKKKRLDLSRYELAEEMLDSLQQQYQQHRTAKKNKKDRRADDRMIQGLEKNDLYIKYPYTIHITEMRSEMENFLHDSLRDQVRFPPLDKHGNSTVKQMARSFHLKTSTISNGKNQHIVAGKTRKTFHYLPDYYKIDGMLKRRPIFHRADQKRPKEEYEKTDGNAKKDRARGRNKGTSAYHLEGDIVGHGAKVIEESNIGRRLLEKLGWVQGEGLGVHGNKGISEPIMAVVKNSKLGLRETKLEQL